jgi:hypothetical protein
MEAHPDESDIPGVVGRRSGRLSIIIPVTVRGTDAAGQAFKENTWTISVNKHGGRIATFHQLADNDQIVIENPLLGQTAKARVKRVCEKRFAEDPYEVCVELLEAQNVWGVKLPPEDWQKERQIAPGDQKSPTPQAAPQAPKTPILNAEKGGTVETAHLAPRGSLADLGEHNGGLSQNNMAVNALSRWAGEANPPLAQPASQRQDAMGVPKAPAGPAQAPDLLALKALQEKIGEAQSLRQELSVLTDRVQSARVEVENLLSKAALEFQAQCKGAAEQAKAELDELVKDATAVVDVRIRKVMEDVSPSLSAQFERSAEQVAREQLEEFRAQIERARRSSQDSTQCDLETMRQETQAEILNAAIQARKVYKEESEAAAKAVSVCVDSTVDSLNRAGDEAVSKLQAAHQTLELSLKKATDEYLPRLADEFASMLEKFRAETQAFAAQLQSEVESTAREFSEKASGDTSEKLEGAVEGALELAARDLNKQAEDALELLKEGLRSAQQQCVDETQRQLAAARESTLTSLESEAGVDLASFTERLHTTLLEMQAQQTKEMEKRIQTSLQGRLESLRTQIHLTADESAARVTAEVTSRAEQTLQELQDRLYKGVGMAALVAKEWEEQAKTDLEAHLSHVLEVFQKQLEGLTMAAQERQRSDAEAFKGLLGSCLHQAARLFEGVEADAGPSREVAREECSNSPSQSLRTSGDPLRPALDLLIEKQQRNIEDALSAFRSGLSRILADQAPKK